MPPVNKINKSTSNLVLAAYYSTVLLFLLGSFFPEQRVWGINSWAYFPQWVPVTLFLIGIFSPVAARIVTRYYKITPTEGGGDNQRSTIYLLLSAGIVLLFGASFYFLRAKAHFLGDGYTVLSLLASDNPLIKTREFGEAWIHVWGKMLVDGQGDTAALKSFVILSISSGVILLTAVSLFARSLFPETIQRVLLTLGIASSGFMLLFFGYVENYSLFLMSVVVFSIAGLVVLRGKLSRWVVGPLLLLAVFFHIIGVALIPSAIYLFTTDTRFGRLLSEQKKSAKLMIVIFCGMIFGTLFYHFYSTDYFVRFAVLPLVSDRFTVDGYTLLSWKHLVDYGNLMLVLLPAFPLLVVLLIKVRLKQVFRNRSYRFLLILSVSLLGTTFIIDPKLGMPRDWDLFSYCGVPLAILCYLLFLGYERLTKPQILLTLMSIVLGFLSLFPRVVSQMMPQVAVSHFENYCILDKTKNRSGRTLLINYYGQVGDSAQVKYEGDRKQADFPQESIVKEAEKHLLEGRAEQAIITSAKAIEIDPVYAVAYYTQGAAYVSLGQYDNAKQVLEIANGLNPYSAYVLHNLALAYFNTNEFDKAERSWKKAVGLDEKLLAPHLYLLKIYGARGEQDRYYDYLMKVGERHDVPVKLLVVLTDYYARNNDFDAAKRTLERALRKGLDSNNIKNLISRYPGLK